MASILNVDKIRATGSTNDAIQFTSGGAAKTNSIYVSAGVTGLQTVTTTLTLWSTMTTKYTPMA